MLFWPTILLVCAAITAVVLGYVDPARNGLSQGDVRLMAVAAFGLLLIITAFGRYGEWVRAVLFRTAIWLVLALMGALLIAPDTTAPRLKSALLRVLDVPQPATVAVATLPRETELSRGWDGHFRAHADVDGVAIDLLFDTGASLVILRYDDAARIGVKVKELDYSIPVTTANGRSHVARITLGSVKIGSVEVREVRAAVAEPGRLHASLLGMSFIEALRETVIRGNLVILRQ